MGIIDKGSFLNCDDVRMGFFDIFTAAKNENKHCEAIKVS